VSEAAFWAVSLGVLGAIIGSFVAALVTRWPDGRSVMQGRSACDACGRTLRAIDLMPLLSALVLRGRCRSCCTPISPVHWRIELAGLAIGVAAGLVVPGPIGIAGAVFGWLLLALASLDLVAFWLPDRLTLLLAATGLASAALDIDPPLPERLIGGIAGFGTLWLVAFGYRRIRGRDGMGGGDPKLFGAIGLWLGWQMLPAVLLIASMIGLGVVLAAHLKGRSMAADTALPFGALLAIAGYPAWLFMIGLTP
jgi:leader peptidase (prepilin peptidase)/N-methyltransferase